MKDEDRVTEILSSKGDMEPDTLEKIDESVSAFSEEQKQHIYDLVIQKKSRADTENEEHTGNDDVSKDDNASNEDENIINIVPVRRQNIMIRIIAAAACISMVFGSVIFLNGKNDERDNNYDEVKTTTVSDTPVTTILDEKNKNSEVSTFPVTAVEKITEPIYVSGITEKAPAVSQTTGVTTTKNENETKTKDKDSSAENEIIKYLHYTEKPDGTLRIDGADIYRIDANDIWRDEENKISKIVLPDTINGKSVTEIGESAFAYSQSLEEIILPDTVSKIGKNAFFGCIKLKSVNIPDNVTVLPEGAFECCWKLKTIDTGKNVTEIGYEAFYECVDLVSVNISKTVESIGQNCFDLCQRLERINVDPENENFCDIDGKLYQKYPGSDYLAPLVYDIGGRMEFCDVRERMNPIAIISSKYDSNYNLFVSSGLNNEQINKFYHAEIFAKFADYSAFITDNPDIDEEEIMISDGRYYRKTSYSYNGYQDYLNSLFSSDGTYNGYKAFDYWLVTNNNRLYICGASPVFLKKTWETVKITESTDSSLKFDIYAYDDGKDGDDYNRNQVSELLRSELNSGHITEDDIKNRKTEDIILNSPGYSEQKDIIESCEVNDDGTYTIHYRYHEEMVKEADGWKFSVFQNPLQYSGYAGKS